MATIEYRDAVILSRFGSRMALLDQKIAKLVAVLDQHAERDWAIANAAGLLERLQKREMDATVSRLAFYRWKAGSVLDHLRYLSSECAPGALAPYAGPLFDLSEHARALKRDLDEQAQAKRGN